MKTTLVINPKGGAGKTTIATNLASYFAANGFPTALMDYDPQGSSLHWVKSRPQQAPKIHAANAAPEKFGKLRSLEMYVPAETQHLIIDAPAGACGLMLQEMIDRAKSIVIPVVPSTIDIHATANFIRDLLLQGRVRARGIRVSVVANKVRRSMPNYQPLERFLNSLNLKLVARLIDSDVFVRAAESGLGIYELDASIALAERKQFAPIIDWVEGFDTPRDTRSDGVVYELPRSRSA